MKQPLYFLLFFCCLAGCSTQTANPPDALVNTDSLNAEFIAAWNTKDSSAIMKILDADAIVMNDSVIHTGTAAIAGNWVSGGVKVLSNIKTTSLKSKADARVAYDAGTYSLNLTPPGGPVLKEKGNYTLIWNRQDNGSWKLVLVHIEDVTRLPDIK